MLKRTTCLGILRGILANLSGIVVAVQDKRGLLNGRYERSAKSNVNHHIETIPGGPQPLRNI